MKANAKWIQVVYTCYVLGMFLQAKSSALLTLLGSMLYVNEFIMRNAFGFNELKLRLSFS